MLINLCKSFHMSDNPSLPKLVLIWDAQFRPLYVKILSASCFNILYICLINLLSSIFKKKFLPVSDHVYLPDKFHGFLTKFTIKSCQIC